MNRIDLSHHRLGQLIQALHRGRKNLSAKAHRPREASTREARDYLCGLCVGLDHEIDLLNSRLTKDRHDFTGAVQVHDLAAACGGAEAHRHLAIGRLFHLNLGDLRHLAQQLVALIQQGGRLAIEILGLTELLIHECQLLGELIQLGDLAVDLALAFLFYETKLTIKLSKSGGKPFGLGQKLATQDKRRRVGRELSGRIKKLIEGREQTHIFAAHNVDHTVGIVNDGALGAQL